MRSRRTALDLVARLAAEAGTVRERFLDPAWQPAWERTLPEVLALLDDPEPRIRCSAAEIVGVCDSPGETVLPALLRRLRAEDDPAARLELVLALGTAVRREPAGARAAETLTLLRELVDAPGAQTRLAAVHALAPGEPDLPVHRQDLLLEAVRDPGVEVWRDTVSVEAGPQGVHHWTAGLIPGPSPYFTLGLLARHPDDEQRIGGLAAAGRLLARWRSPTAALAPAVAGRLDDPAVEVRFRAAELMACLGPAAAEHADEVAARLGDTALRATRQRQTVAEAALWALARMNDPRCLPGLIELIESTGLLSGRASGFASGSAHYPAADWHHAVLPALDEVLTCLTDHTDRLVPVICDRLHVGTRRNLLAGLCEVLGHWGTASEVAVPHLLDLLEDDSTWVPAATALAKIGAAGSGVRDLVADSEALGLLAARFGTGDGEAGLAEWAYWQVGGDPQPALAVLGAAVGADRFVHPALRKLAGLGPYAAPLADRFRTLTASTEPWTSVEAAHALWATTGDTETAVPTLTKAVQALPGGTYLPVVLPAVRHLARIGVAARPAASLLAGIDDLDRRLRNGGGWRGFTEDETIRAAVDELLAAAT